MKTTLISSLICFIVLVNICFSQTISRTQTIKIEKMPLVPPVPLVGDEDLYGMPVEDRGEEYKNYLSPSLKVIAAGSSGSGTIIYYDKNKNIAYVATCGHLWNNGVLNFEQAEAKRIKCEVVTWYNNDIKLEKTKTYQADVLFYSHVTGCDTALIAFKPDWQPEYFPIGPKNYQYLKGTKVHSMGCDGAREVAHYDVEIVGIRGDDLVTVKNSPRPGRSGGGLVDNNKTYIGTCWGTTSFNGDGQGFFTPLSVIHEFWNKNNYGWLLEVSRPKIEIIDRINNKKIIENNYILMPSSN